MRFYLIQGFVLWLVATVLLRLVGQWLFLNLATIVAAYFVIAVGLVFGLRRLFSRRKSDSAQQMQLALALCLPGMVLDVITISLAGQVFPNIPASAHTTFAGLLLWAYSVALLVSLWPTLSRTSLEA